MQQLSDAIPLRRNWRQRVDVGFPANRNSERSLPKHHDGSVYVLGPKRLHSKGVRSSDVRGQVRALRIGLTHGPFVEIGGSFGVDPGQLGSNRNQAARWSMLGQPIRTR